MKSFEKFDLETVVVKKLDVILKKEDEIKPLTSREQRKRIYNINSRQ